jgi:hypothetical protein
MLQIAGLAAILNEINPKFTEKLQNIFNSNIEEKLVVPLKKSYKHGYINGLMTGIIISGATVFIIWKRKQTSSKKIDYLPPALKTINT